MKWQGAVGDLDLGDQHNGRGKNTYTEREANRVGSEQGPRLEHGSIGQKHQYGEEKHTPQRKNKYCIVDKRAKLSQQATATSNNSSRNS